MIEGVGPNPEVALPAPVVPGTQPDEELVDGPPGVPSPPLPTVPADPGAIGTPPGPTVWRGMVVPDAPGAIGTPPGPVDTPGLAAPPGFKVPGTAVPGAATPGDEIPGEDIPGAVPLGADAPGAVPVLVPDDPVPEVWASTNCEVKTNSPAVSAAECHARPDLPCMLASFCRRDCTGS